MPSSEKAVIFDEMFFADDEIPKRDEVYQLSLLGSSVAVVVIAANRRAVHVRLPVGTGRALSAMEWLGSMPIRMGHYRRRWLLGLIPIRVFVPCDQDLS